MTRVNKRRLTFESRRASQSHPPPDVQVREGDNSNSKGGDYCEDKGGSEADDKDEGSRPNNSNAPPPDPQKNTERGKGGGEEGGWRGLLRTALRRKEQATGTSSSARKEERQQGQPSNHHENGTFEVDGGGGGGSRDGAEDGVNVLGGGAVSPTTPTGTPTVIGSKTTAGKAAAPNGTGDDGHNNREGKKGRRQPVGWRAGRDGHSGGSESTDDVPSLGPKQRKEGATCGEGSDAELEHRKRPSSQKGERAYGSGKGSGGIEGRKEEGEASPSLCRPAPSDFWESVERGKLSAKDLEGVLNEIPEEDAEYFLRERGMVDKEGNLNLNP